MPPAVDLTALTAAVTTGFANVVTAINTVGQASVDLAPLVSQVERVADALYVDDPSGPQSITKVAADSNAQITSVIGTYSDGERVRVFNETPTP